MRGPPQHDQPEYNKHVGAGVEEAVEDGIEFQVLNAVRRITGAGVHVMPLKQLMQHDAVEKAAQPEPEQDTA